MGYQNRAGIDSASNAAFTRFKLPASTLKPCPFGATPFAGGFNSTSVSGWLRTELFMVDEILKLLGREDYVPLNPAEMVHELGLPPQRRRDLERELRSLEQAG